MIKIAKLRSVFSLREHFPSFQVCKYSITEINISDMTTTYRHRVIKLTMSHPYININVCTTSFGKEYNWKINIVINYL